jgi:hypothetical protein
MCMLRDWPLRLRRIFRRVPARRFAATMFCLAAVTVATSSSALAEPLEYVPFASFWVKGVYSRIEGRMGFDQENGGVGTLNDLIQDLGLPVSNLTIDLGARVRPLEHHVLRVYGRIPEVYKGGRTLSRTLQTRTETYLQGTAILSELKTEMFGLGYDLDFLVGPRWFGGLNGDLRHVGIRIRMGNAASVFEDTMSINEMVPCLGAHLLFRAPARVGPRVGLLTVGGFSRITFSMTPNWLNYFDVSAGFSLGIFRSCSLSVESRLGYNYEVFFHNQESLAGRALELQRDGVLLSVEGLF